jgi:hypothetical protein
MKWNFIHNHGGTDPDASGHGVAQRFSVILCDLRASVLKTIRHLIRVTLKRNNRIFQYSL